MENPNWNETGLKPGERLDELQRGGYRIIQEPGRFCFGMDAVLLAWFARVQPGARALDLGTGTGIIPILLAARTRAAHLVGLEIQPEGADMAARSVRLNGLEGKIHIVQGDIREAAELFPAASFDVVTANPPYITGGHGPVGLEEARAVARHEVKCTLRDTVRAAGQMLKPGGIFYMVHRPFRLAEIMAELVGQGLEPKRMRLVYPYVDREPNMVLLEARKGAGSRIRIEKPLIVFERPGVYTEEVKEIYG